MVALVYSRDMRWIPEGIQSQAAGIKANFSECRPVHDDILLAKLRPGQNIDLEAYACKGVGQTHTKWSPVSTASYRLMPDITLDQPVQGDMADELVKLCPMKVFDIEDLSNGKGRRAVVANARSCTMCRECIRDPKWRNFVSLKRVKNHFIFSVESTGALPASRIFTDAVRILMNKCMTIENELRKMASKDNPA